MDPDSLADEWSSKTSASSNDATHWPNRGPAIIAAEVVYTLIGTSFVIWRLVVVYLAKRKYLLPDYLIFFAMVGKLCPWDFEAICDFGFCHYLKVVFILTNPS